MVKKDIEIHPKFEPGSSPMNSGQMLKPTEPLTLEQRIDGFMHTHSSVIRLDLS